MHDFERNRAVEARVGGAVDGGHATPRYAFVDPVPAVDKTTDQRIGPVGIHNRRVYVRRGAPPRIWLVCRMVDIW
jgi:hypothetical protein